MVEVAVLRGARECDIAHVAANMRQADRDEVRAIGGVSAREALDVSVKSRGDCWTGLLDGEPAAIFGVVPQTVLGGSALVWLLGTPLLEKHWRTFTRASRPITEALLARYDTLFNIVHEDNRMALRWLRWLGATFKQHGSLVYFELRAKQ